MTRARARLGDVAAPSGGGTGISAMFSGLAVVLALLFAIVLAGCADGRPTASATTWTPDAGTTWQWQLSVSEGGQPNITYDADVYDLDLFETSQVTIDALHDQGRRVVCYFSAGSSETDRDDFDRFTDADQGNVLDGWPDERWLDLASDNVRAVMTDRLDLAAAKGCDGVEPDNTDGYAASEGGGSGDGLGVTEADTLSYLRWLAGEAHERGLTIGLKNTLGLAETLAGTYDFAVNEQCHEFDECGKLQPFIELDKPVLNTEYVMPDTSASARRELTPICTAAQAAGTTTLILPLALDDAFRLSCPPPSCAQIPNRWASSA